MKYCKICRRFIHERDSFCPGCGRRKVQLEEKKIGDTIEIGKWDGEPVEWIILNICKQKNRALLLSKNALLKREYNEKRNSITWERCTLRHYLQTEFIRQVFTDSEDRKRIVSVKNQNADNQKCNTFGCNATWDQVFLLSIDEFQRYFYGNKNLSLYEKCYDKNGTSDWWWLRSPGTHGSLAAGVLSDGSLDVSGYNVDYDFPWVRPAFYYNL